MALRLEMALPWGVLGPVDFWALRWLAWRRVLFFCFFFFMVFSFEKNGYGLKELGSFRGKGMGRINGRWR